MHRLKSCLLSMAEKIREMISGGIIWIFGGGIVSQICGMISSMVVIQFLSPLLFAEFGINNTSFCFTELLAKRKHKKKKIP